MIAGAESGLADSPAWPPRLGAVAALLAGEYVVVTLLVDLAALGPARRLAAVVRVLSPAVVGAAAAGLLLARSRPRVPSVLAHAADHRPWRALGLQLLAFAATALSGHVLLGPGAPPPSRVALAAWLAAGGTAVVLAAFVVLPPRALLRMTAEHARAPLLALAVGLLAWRAVAAFEQTWGSLRNGTLAGVAALLRAVFPDVLVLPAESAVGVGAFEVEIAPACSGVEGLGLVLVFQTLWLSLARERVRFGRALLVLVPLAAAASLAANVVRIAALVLLGASGHEALALGAFHSKLGWVLFAAIAVGSVALAERLPWLRRTAAPGEPAVEAALPPAAAAYVAPLLAALAMALVTSLWAQRGLDRAYGARVVAGALALLLVRRSLPRPALSVSWPPLAIGALACACWIPLASAGGSSMPQALAALGASERLAWVALRLAGACVVLPIVEELAFRGFLLPWLVSPDLDAPGRRAWNWPAVAISSLAFGAVHEQWLLGTAAGVAFAAARLWRGRLGDAIIAHVVCNVGVALAVLLGGRWDLWG